MFYYKNVNSYVNACKRDQLIRNGDETFNKPLSVMIKIASVIKHSDGGDVNPLIYVTRDITQYFRLIILAFTSRFILLKSPLQSRLCLVDLYVSSKIQIMVPNLKTFLSRQRGRNGVKSFKM